MTRRIRPVRVAALLALALAAAAPPSAAQDTAAADGLRLETWLDWETVADPQVSPDGSRVVYTRRWVDRMSDDWTSALWIMDADGSRNRFLAEGSAPRWSPDGTRIAYLAAGEPRGTQLFVRWMDAEGATSQITRTEHAPSDVRWSPDGERIAFAMFAPSSEPWSIDMPSAPEGAEWTEPPRKVERVHFRQDRVGFTDEGTYHLFVVPAAGGTPRALTEGDGVVGAPFSGLRFGAALSWTPDGRSVVFDGLMEPGWESTYAESYLYAADVETGRVRRIVDEKGLWGSPVVSPDGRRVAFTGHPFTTQTYRAADLWVVGLDGSGMRRISGDLDRDPQEPTWAPDGRGVYFTAGSEGAQNVYLASLDGGVRQVTEGEHMLGLASVARDGTAVGVRSAPHEPGDVVRYRLPSFDGLTELTGVNDDVLAGIELGDVEEIWFEAEGGPPAQGWIVKPPDFDSSRDYPLILRIHGGPHAMYNAGFDFKNQNHAANGYVVLYTNPRGSSGYGSEFGNAINFAYPSMDYDDLMAGVDAVVDRGWVDTDNMFVYGCSGGGVLTSWVIGHTNRFRAAGVLCPVINWMSFAGTADIVQWGYHRYEGYPWTNPEKYLRHSPLMYVENVETPTLIMTGELDLRTPMSQSEEYYQALKAVGVPTVLLRFHEEYHGTSSKPSNFMRTQLYLMSWFERWGSHDERVAAEDGG
ncbi:MAG: S9 family peptidase [Gemmatimonadetes bacterium]|nr:S9 family peptidase [Gemmatimonadota bacterium]